MRKILLLIVVMGIAVSLASAQKIPSTQVPAAVLKAFQTKFPGIAEPQWELKKDTYKAEFKVGSRGHDVWITKAGVITKVKEDFPKSELPKAIQLKVAQDFKEYSIEDADKITMDGKTFYRLKLKGATANKKISLTEDGQVSKDITD